MISAKLGDGIIAKKSIKELITPPTKQADKKSIENTQQMVSKADVLKTIRLPKVDRTEHVAVAKEVIKEIKKSVEIEKETSPSPLVETLKEVKETLQTIKQNVGKSKKRKNFDINAQDNIWDVHYEESKDAILKEVNAKIEAKQEIMSEEVKKEAPVDLTG